MKRKKDFSKIYNDIVFNQRVLCSEYSECMIIVPWAQRWKYAIPENYTNYQGGFIMEDDNPYRGKPILNYNGEILYLRYIVPWYGLGTGTVEHYLLFDRHGRKYSYIVQDAPEEEKQHGNPSYFDFLLRVKEYKPSLHKSFRNG